jgi:hypothetical protein
MSRSSKAGLATAPPTVAPAPTISAINFFCQAFGVADGYGKSADEICGALERLGVQVHLIGSIWGAGHTNNPFIFRRYLDKLTDPVNSVQLSKPVVFYSLPTTWFPYANLANGKNRGIGFSMFECDSLPADWIPPLNNVEEIWVPSEYNRETFQKFTKRPVHIVPLGVDASRFPYYRRQRGAKLNFLHYSTVGTETRKGADLAIKAFQLAFPYRDDVYLELRCSRMTWDKPIADQRIKATAGMLTDAELSTLYNRFDALIYPSRGEGFGLIPLEAMASGMPTIHTGATGMAAFAHLGMTVDSRRVPAQVGAGRPMPANWIYREGFWQEPDLAGLVDHMRTVDRAYQSVMDKAAEDSKIVARDFTWERTARVIQARLEKWDVPVQSPAVSVASSV